MIEIPLLDLHVTHTCNLTCESCSDFTNHRLTGMLSLEDAKNWMSRWNKRLNPKKFILLGGEPTLNKNLIEILYISREMWPNSKLFLTSNAFFLHLHENLGKAIKDTDAILSISIHDNSEEYISKIRQNLRLCKQWIEKYNIKVSLTESYNKWNMIYKGYGSSIMPFEDNDPESSWKSCFMDENCFQLHEGKIWKCPPIAYLPLMAKKYTLSEKWDPYLKYKPLDSDCNDEELIDFFNKKAESCCGMCPAKETYKTGTIKSPLLSVKESLEYFSRYD